MGKINTIKLVLLMSCAAILLNIRLPYLYASSDPAADYEYGGEGYEVEQEMAYGDAATGDEGETDLEFVTAEGADDGSGYGNEPIDDTMTDAEEMGDMPWDYSPEGPTSVYEGNDTGDTYFGGEQSGDYWTGAEDTASEELFDYQTGGVEYNKDTENIKSLASDYADDGGVGENNAPEMVSTGEDIALGADLLPAKPTSSNIPEGNVVATTPSLAPELWEMGEEGDQLEQNIEPEADYPEYGDMEGIPPGNEPTELYFNETDDMYQAEPQGTNVSAEAPAVENLWEMGEEGDQLEQGLSEEAPVEISTISADMPKIDDLDPASEAGKAPQITQPLETSPSLLGQGVSPQQLFSEQVPEEQRQIEINQIQEEAQAKLAGVWQVLDNKAKLNLRAAQEQAAIADQSYLSAVSGWFLGSESPSSLAEKQMAEYEKNKQSQDAYFELKKRVSSNFEDAINPKLDLETRELAMRDLQGYTREAERLKFGEQLPYSSDTKWVPLSQWTKEREAAVNARAEYEDEREYFDQDAKNRLQSAKTERPLSWQQNIESQIASGEIRGAEKLAIEKQLLSEKDDTADLLQKAAQDEVERKKAGPSFMESVRNYTGRYWGRDFAEDDLKLLPEKTVYREVTLPDKTVQLYFAPEQRSDDPLSMIYPAFSRHGLLYNGAFVATDRYRNRDQIHDVVTHELAHHVDEKLRYDLQSRDAAATALKNLSPQGQEELKSFLAESIRSKNPDRRIEEAHAEAIKGTQLFDQHSEGLRAFEVLWQDELGTIDRVVNAEIERMGTKNNRDLTASEKELAREHLQEKIGRSVFTRDWQGDDGLAGRYKEIKDDEIAQSRLLDAQTKREHVEKIYLKLFHRHPISEFIIESGVPDQEDLPSSIKMPKYK